MVSVWCFKKGAAALAVEAADQGVFSSAEAYVVLAPGESSEAPRRLYMWAGDDAPKAHLTAAAQHAAALMQADEGAEGDATEVAYLQLSQGSEGDDFKQLFSSFKVVAVAQHADDAVEEAVAAAAEGDEEEEVAGAAGATGKKKRKNKKKKAAAAAAAAAEALEQEAVTVTAVAAPVPAPVTADVAAAAAEPAPVAASPAPVAASPAPVAVAPSPVAAAAPSPVVALQQQEQQHQSPLPAPKPATPTPPAPSPPAAAAAPAVTAGAAPEAATPKAPTPPGAAAAPTPVAAVEGLEEDGEGEGERVAADAASVSAVKETLTRRLSGTFVSDPLAKPLIGSGGKAASTYLADSAKVWGGSGAAAAPVAATAKIKPGEQTFGYAELKGLRPESGIDMTRKEAYLTDAEFEKVFGRERSAWSAQPAWRQQMAKKAAGLW